MTSFLRKAVAAAVLATLGVAAQAQVNASLNFDSATSGSTANAYLASQGLDSFMHFANPDRVDDAPVYDSVGNLLNDGAFHWVDATATYGDVLVKNDGTAVSPGNVLWNDHAPILLVFNNGPTDLASFSIQQDTSGFGNLQTNGTFLAFLDATGHVMGGSSVFYTQGPNPGLLISSGPVFGASAVLLAAGVSYDNLTISAVPEPEALLMLATGLGLVGWQRRRKLR